MQVIWEIWPGFMTTILIVLKDDLKLITMLMLFSSIGAAFWTLTTTSSNFYYAKHISKQSILHSPSLKFVNMSLQWILLCLFLQRNKIVSQLFNILATYLSKEKMQLSISHHTQKNNWIVIIIWIACNSFNFMFWPLVKQCDGLLKTYVKYKDGCTNNLWASCFFSFYLYMGYTVIIYTSKIREKCCES